MATGTFPLATPPPQTQGTYGRLHDTGRARRYDRPASPENPFRNRNKVTDPAGFYGRRAETKLVLEEILYPEPQSVAIIGERRIGKSSLLSYLYCLMTDLSIDVPGRTDKHVCIKIDPEELVIDDPYGLTWVIIDELVRAQPALHDFIKDSPTADLRKDNLPRRPEIIRN